MKKYLTQKAFAELVGVSSAAIFKAIRDGRVVKTSRGIDPDHPTNKYYLEQTSRYRDPKTNGKKAGSKSENRSTKKKAKKKTAKSEQEKEQETEREEEIVIRPKIRSGRTKANAERKRIEAQTTKLNIEIARKMGILVLREDVSKAFGKIYSVAINHFLPMGDRLAPILAGICGTSDQERVIKVKEKIDNEMTRALEELKRGTETFDGPPN
jgi:hypothetical protein